MDDQISLIDEKDLVSIAPSATQEAITITDPASDRYNTFGFISWWKQEIVRNATVMVIGAGALGNEVLKNLALMGVGQILIIDFDTIDDSNLSRSILYRGSDNGRKKAEVAAQSVQEVNPDVAVQWMHADINHDIGLGVYRRMDAVIGCLDNREARISINQSCWRLNKPWIDGAIQSLLGIARVFRPDKGPCYECTLTDEDYRIIGKRTSCNYLAHQAIIEGKVPSTPTISSIIAAIETQEALKLLHGIPVEYGKAMVFDGLKNDVYHMEYSLKSDCPSNHEVFGEIIELPEARANHTTLGELLDIARKQMGDIIRLKIPRFVPKVSCPHGHIESEFMRPIWLLTFDEAHCSQCGEAMTVNSIEWISGDEPFLDLTLSQVGIPPLDIIKVRTDKWQERYFELTGDATGTLRFSKATAEFIKSFFERRTKWQRETK